MTTPTLIEAARAALDALGSLIDAQNGPPLVRHAASWLCAMNGASASMQALRAAIEAAEGAQPEPARQPMTEREIIGGFEVLPEALTFFTAFEAGVRHAERHHGIGVETAWPETQRQRKDSEAEITFLRRVADARQQIIDGMIAERCAKQDAEMPRPRADWREDDGAVVWWWFLVDEPAWIGTPLDDDWPGYHTHWTPHPKLPERER